MIKLFMITIPFSSGPMGLRHYLSPALYPGFTSGYGPSAASLKRMFFIISETQYIDDQLLIYLVVNNRTIRNVPRHFS
jgi:hypothetical protein